MKATRVTGAYRPDGTFRLDTLSDVSTGGSRTTDEWNTVANVLRLRDLSGKTETENICFDYNIPISL